MGVSLYDVPSEDGNMCYRKIGWNDTWMNDSTHMTALGVDPTREFKLCYEKVNKVFWLQGDGMRNSAVLLPELINDSVRLLVYAGNANFASNFMGNACWISGLDHKFHNEFAASESTQWIITGSGRVAGEVRSVGGGGFGVGNVNFGNIHEARQMAPFNQPEAALEYFQVSNSSDVCSTFRQDIFTRWISDVSLTVS